MHKHVTWSQVSESDLDNVLEYLFSNWGIEVVENFLNEIDIQIYNIKSNPRQFPFADKKKKVRKCIISKHNTFYYKVNENVIEIIRLFDTRQNPDKLKL